jgi:asparagine synthase (glutamine-hydrolysing)
MCGIAGIYGFGLDDQIITRMVKAMDRRGPDDSGIWMNDNRTIALGQTRLSIIDISESGHQPMCSHNNRYIIVFNGEIYNYKELKGELEKKNLTFKTQSDTEVILKAWEMWGKKSLSSFRGMFAFAILDQWENSLTFARDRMGIKPLLWTKINNKVLFASSITSLIASGIINPILNNQSFFDFLSSGSVFQPKTIIKGINAVMPGTILQIKDGAITIETYWELKRDELLTFELGKISYEDQIRETRRVLEEACNYHLVADVPVGSFLSGGVDSTVVTALMAKNSRYKIKSFSIGFRDGPDLKNELNEAKIASDFIGTDHTEVLLSGKEVYDSFDDFISIIDQPSDDGLNTYWVSRIAKNEVKVTLSGLGSDEIFAGYSHFSWPSRFSKATPNFFDKQLGKLYYAYPRFRYTYYAYLKLASSYERLATLRRKLTDCEISRAVTPEISKEFSFNQILRYIEAFNLKHENNIYDISLYECKGYLLNTLLRDADALSMGNSLEVRPIFLDHKLAEFALSLPDESKWKNGIGKSVLKDACADLLPPNFFLRKKTGFTLPISRWINNELKSRAIDTFNDVNSRIFFSKYFLKNSVDNLSNPRRSWNNYMIFVFLEWAKKMKIYVEQS